MSIRPINFFAAGSFGPFGTNSVKLNSGIFSAQTLNRVITDLKIKTNKKYPYLKLTIIASDKPRELWNILNKHFAENKKLAFDHPNLDFVLSSFVNFKLRDIAQILKKTSSEEIYPIYICPKPRTLSHLVLIVSLETQKLVERSTILYWGVQLLPKSAQEECTDAKEILAKILNYLSARRLDLQDLKDFRSKFLDLEQSSIFSDEFLNQQRENMVENLIQKGYLSDERVIAAMRKIKRETLVDSDPLLWPHIYEDSPLSIGFGQTISAPHMHAYMTQLLNLTGKEKVLEIGTGSGYQTALLAELLKEGGQVFTIEIVKELFLRAQKALGELDYKNIMLFEGDGNHGLPSYQPFDRIVITAASTELQPPLLYKQLKKDGIMILPYQPKGKEYGELYKITKRDEGAEIERGIPCLFVPLKEST